MRSIVRVGRAGKGEPSRPHHGGAAEGRRLCEGGQIALRHVGEDGGPIGYLANPSGSTDDIAALTDATGRILGLMPHPERNVDRTQHPLWTRRPDVDEPDGLKFFRRAVSSCA